MCGMEYVSWTSLFLRVHTVAPSTAPAVDGFRLGAIVESPSPKVNSTRGGGGGRVGGVVRGGRDGGDDDVDGDGDDGDGGDRRRR